MFADLDCTGLNCPECVLRARKALESARASFTVLVDNTTARNNVAIFARSAGCSVSIDDTGTGFLVSITPSAMSGIGVDELPAAPARAHLRKVVFIGSDEIGKGKRELGVTLMKMFLFTGPEAEDRPTTLIFMNSGVRLVTENEETAAYMKALVDRGTVVLVCGTCLDYYGLKEKLKAGSVSNMFEIQSTMISADLFISL